MLFPFKFEYEILIYWHVNEKIKKYTQRCLTTKLIDFISLLEEKK